MISLKIEHIFGKIMDFSGNMGRLKEDVLEKMLEDS
jgi:hypothetical protein